MDVMEYTLLPKDSLITEAVSNVYHLWYNGTILQQVFGTVMRSLVSRFWTVHRFLFFFWKRYVDNVLSAVSASQVDDMLSYTNSAEQIVQFTLV